MIQNVGRGVECRMFGLTLPVPASGRVGPRPRACHRGALSRRLGRHERTIR